VLKRPAPAARHDRGSALLLVPAAVLVVIVLASIAVDSALVHLRQRQALDLAASAANDAATAGTDPDRVRVGETGLDPVAARRTVEQAIAASDLAPDLVGAPVVHVTDDRVEVVLTVEARRLFAGAIPGAADTTTLTARASARTEDP
jgi:hypothetical protein